jgi:hypothetical protein
MYRVIADHFVCHAHKQQYPVYVKGMKETYAWIREFYLNYDKWYQVWEEYHQNILTPMFKPGGKYGTSMYRVIADHFVCHAHKQQDYVQEYFKSKATGIPAQIAEFVKDRQQFVLFDVIKEMDCFDVLERKTHAGDRETRRIIFSTDWSEMRMVLKHFFGWKDGKKVGEFVR